MQAVIDTNVIVSGLISPHGSTAEIVQMISAGELVPVFDDRVFAEYQAVLKRSNFSFPTEIVDQFLNAIKSLGLQVIALHSNVVLPDDHDRCFLECALSIQSKILITGNKKHFPSKVCAAIRIFSPAEFMDCLRASS